MNYLPSIIETGVMLVGLIILGIYQKNKIDALKLQVSTQKDTLDSVKNYFDIVKSTFDPQVIQNYVAMKEETITAALSAELNKMKTDKNAKETLGILLEEIRGAAHIMQGLMYYVPLKAREEAISQAPESTFKEAMRQVQEKVPFYGNVFAENLLLLMEDRENQRIVNDSD